MNTTTPKSIKTPVQYIAYVPEDRRKDIIALDKLIRKIAKGYKRYIQVGGLAYGSYHYKYASGREGDWAVIALANQKNYISLYVCMTENGKYIAEKYKSKLPKASIGKSCVRFKKLADVNLKHIEGMLRETVAVANKLPKRNGKFYIDLYSKH